MRTVLPYDRRAIEEVIKYRTPPAAGFFSQAINTVTEPVGKAADWLFDTNVGRAVARAVQGIVALLNDGASWSVRTSTILEEFREDGHTSVQRPSDIQALDLESVERTLGLLSAKYKSAALIEGTLAGAGGVAGIAVDIPTLVAMALRAVNEYATYYGFDVAVQGERMYALNVLSAASSPSMAAKQAALAELRRVGVLVAQRKTWEELQRVFSVQAIKKIAEALGIRLTKAKLAQVVPVVGAVVGGGFNAWYLSQVTETAFMAYRERFLLEKYGPAVFEEKI